MKTVWGNAVETQQGGAQRRESLRECAYIKEDNSRQREEQSVLSFWLWISKAVAQRELMGELCPQKILGKIEK